jgi:hypothetical protein
MSLWYKLANQLFLQLKASPFMAGMERKAYRFSCINFHESRYVVAPKHLDAGLATI